MTILQHFLRSSTWIILFVIASALMMKPAFASAQFNQSDQSQCYAGAVDQEDDGYDGGYSNDVEQSACFYYDSQSGFDAYVETDNDYNENFYSEYGNDNLQTFGVGAEAQIWNFVDPDVLADSGMNYGSTDGDGGSPAYAHTSYMTQEPTYFVMTVYYSECQGNNYPNQPCSWGSAEGFSIEINLQPVPDLSVTTSGTPSVAGQPVTFTATISNGPTGDIAFYIKGNTAGWISDGYYGTPIGTINGGTASYTANALPGDTYTVSAYYLGDSNYAQVQSSAITQVVSGQLPATLSLSTSGTPSTAGDWVTFIAYISSGPAGTVTFYDGNIALGSDWINYGFTHYSTNALTPGLHYITASYSGYEGYSATSNTITQVVDSSLPAIAVSCSPSTVTYGDYAFLMCTATDNGADGYVVFSGATMGAGYYLSGGSASSYFYAYQLPAGSYNVAANYYGYGTNILASGSTTVTIQKATPTVSVTTLGTPSEPGQSVNFKAYISPIGINAPTGTLTFGADGSSIGSVAVNGSITPFTISSLSSGGHTVSISYSGDANYNAVSSSPITQYVLTPTPTGPNSPIITSLTPDLGSGGVSVTITGHSFGASTGSITFNGVPASVSSWSSSSIVANVPGSATTGPVVIVTSNGVSSNGMLFRTPVIPNCPI